MTKSIKWAMQEDLFAEPPQRIDDLSTEGKDEIMAPAKLKLVQGNETNLYPGWPIPQPLPSGLIPVQNFSSRSFAGKFQTLCRRLFRTHAMSAGFYRTGVDGNGWVGHRSAHRHKAEAVR